MLNRILPSEDEGKVFKVYGEEISLLQKRDKARKRGGLKFETKKRMFVRSGRVEQV